MVPAVVFHQLFRDVLARQVEYSYGDEAEAFTTMVPLKTDRLPQVLDLMRTVPFAGDWSWSVARFAGAVRPDSLLFRVDWLHQEPTAVTLYCRFPFEPDGEAFRSAVAHAHPFRWNGPEPASVAAALGLAGPRGIAFRATKKGARRTSLYFRSEEHAGAAWSRRLPGLLAACGYPEDLAPAIEDDLKGLYRPGPVGVIGFDGGGDAGGTGAIKFDPSNVPGSAAFAFLARAGASAARITALKRIAIGLRAESLTYVGVQYGREGLSGWRAYFACEPMHARTPGKPAFDPNHTLKPVRRLPHY